VMMGEVKVIGIGEVRGWCQAETAGQPRGGGPGGARGRANGLEQIVGRC
jgi:hypothetical protein